VEPICVEAGDQGFLLGSRQNRDQRSWSRSRQSGMILKSGHVIPPEIELAVSGSTMQPETRDSELQKCTIHRKVILYPFFAAYGRNRNRPRHQRAALCVPDIMPQRTTVEPRASSSLRGQHVRRMNFGSTPRRHFDLPVKPSPTKTKRHPGMPVGPPGPGRRAPSDRRHREIPDRHGRLWSFSNTPIPASLQQTASPSTTVEPGASAATAARMTASARSNRSPDV
jgi:hypothetical protein